MFQKQYLAACSVAALTISAGCANAAVDAEQEVFGTLEDGTEIEAVVLTNESGVSVRLMTLGASIQSFTVPDKNGDMDDIVLGHDTPAEYLANPQYMGATVGRFGNRIAEGKFTLDGTEYTLATNDGDNHLHGGDKGFDKQVWDIASVDEGSDEASVTFTRVSPDGEEGYPGTLNVSVTYTLGEDGDLTIDHRATTDKTTIVNLTNHSYFNLSGHENFRPILGMDLMIPADGFTPVDAGLIPTGEIRDVDGTPFDFREPMEIGARLRNGNNQQIVYGLGYDHNFVLSDSGEEMKTAAMLSDPVSGRTLEILTDQPAVQFYSGNFLDGSVSGKGGTLYRQGDALCLEPQKHPDSPNQPDFPDTTLEPGEEFVHVMILRPGVAE